MLDRVFPPAAEFTYRGSRIALWLLGLVLILKLGIALGAIFNGHYAATVADGIPIDSYTPEGAQAFLSLFASLGLSQFMLAALGVVILVRYRALVPVFLLMLIVDPRPQRYQRLHSHRPHRSGARGCNQLGDLRNHDPGVHLVRPPKRSRAGIEQGVARRPDSIEPC